MGERHHSDSGARARRVRRGIAVFVTLLIAASACTPTAGGGGTATTTPQSWNPACTQLFPCGLGRRYASAGSGDSVLLVGDSILEGFNMIGDYTSTDLTQVAATRVAQTGVRTRLYTSVGSTFYSWNTGSILTGGHLQTGSTVDTNIAELNQGQNPPTRHVVIALGTNDASYIGQTVTAGLPNPRSFGPRTQQDVSDQVLLAINQALISSTNCVILVTPPTHGNATRAAVNQRIDFVAAARNAQLGRQRVVTADFDALASGQPWFSDGVHLNQEGYGRYLDLIAFMVAAAQNNPC